MGSRLPSTSDRAELVRALRAVAEDVDKTVADPESGWWGQVLRSSAVQTRLFETDDSTSAYRRDEQMANNLLWSMQNLYPDRKVIVWAHTYHAMRSPTRPVSSWKYSTVSMGRRIWEAIGERSVAIGFTSYDGSALFATASPDQQQDVISDQVPALEFEELMEAAGHEVAWVDLRRARAGPSWLSESFSARAIEHVNAELRWSEVLDALVFVRTQQPSIRVTGLR
jgi:erythromycin esterase